MWVPCSCRCVPGSCTERTQSGQRITSSSLSQGDWPLPPALLKTTQTQRIKKNKQGINQLLKAFNTKRCIIFLHLFFFLMIKVLNWTFNVYVGVQQENKDIKYKTNMLSNVKIINTNFCFLSCNADLLME